MREITYKELRKEHGLSNKQIQKLDRKKQMIFGHALKMIDGCLKSKEDSENKISTCLMYVSMAEEMLEKNIFDEILECLPKEALN